MNVSQLKKFCRHLPGANERLFPDPWNILVYSLNKTNFAYFKTSEPEKWRFSIKVSPDRFIELTGIPGVKPARFRGRYRWITIVDVAAFPADYLRELVEWSHRYALESLPRSRQKQVLAATHTLKAAGLVLEPLNAAHADEMFAVLSDAEIYRHLDYGPPQSIEQLRAQYLRQEKGSSADGREKWLNWILRSEDGSPLGYVQATVMPDGRAWIAYVLSSKHWGHGYALNAVEAMMMHLTSVHGTAHFLATVEADNRRSIALLVRLGFREAGAAETSAHKLSASERLFLR